MSEKHTKHNPGNQKDGEEYQVGNNIYQRFWCRESGCSMSIPVVVRTIND